MLLYFDLDTVAPYAGARIETPRCHRSGWESRFAGEAAADELLAFLHQHSVVPVIPEIAALAATLGLRHQLAMADALIYATAQNQNATLWTQDADLQGLPNVRYFPKIKL